MQQYCNLLLIAVKQSPFPLPPHLLQPRIAFCVGHWVPDYNTALLKAHLPQQSQAQQSPAASCREGLRLWALALRSSGHGEVWGGVQGSLGTRFSTPDPCHRAEGGAAIPAPGGASSTGCPGHAALQPGNWESLAPAPSLICFLYQTPCSSKDICSRTVRSYFCSLCFCWQNKRDNWNLNLIKVLTHGDCSSMLCLNSLVFIVTLFLLISNLCCALVRIWEPMVSQEITFIFIFSG